MKVLLDSMLVAGRWKIKKQLFWNDHKLFVSAYDQNDPNNQTTLLLMSYEQSVEQQLVKSVHQIKKTGRQGRNAKLIVPEKPTVQNIKKAKLLVMRMVEKPLSLNWLMNSKGHQFSPLEIIEAAISGIGSLSELHSLNIMHTHINPKTCYFYNRQRKLSIRKVGKVETATFFGVCIIDADKFNTKIPTQENRINELLYEPCSKALGLKPGFKDDVQSMLYVLVKMATNNSIFCSDRYHKQWKCDENVRKWKNTEFYLQMLKKVPPSLWFLAQLYLTLQEMSPSEKVDYSSILKKLWKEKEEFMSRQRLTGAQVIELRVEGNKDSAVEQKHSQDSIFEEDIKIDIRRQETSLERVKLLED